MSVRRCSTFILFHPFPHRRAPFICALQGYRSVRSGCRSRKAADVIDGFLCSSLTCGIFNGVRKWRSIRSCRSRTQSERPSGSFFFFFKEGALINQFKRFCSSLPWFLSLLRTVSTWIYPTESSIGLNVSAHTEKTPRSCMKAEPWLYKCGLCSPKGL